jgi:hypothetical protein
MLGGIGVLKVILIEISYLLYWPGILSLALTLFRFKLRPILLQIILSSLLLSNISVMLQTTNLVYLLAIIQFLSAFACLWLIFRIPMRFSFLMMLIAYLIGLGVEWIETALIPQMFIQFIDEANMFDFFYTGMILNITIWSINVLLRKKRIGFSFIPQNMQQKLQFTGSLSLRVAMIGGLLTVLLSSIFNFLYPKALISLSIALATLIAILLRISYRWEVAD